LLRAPVRAPARSKVDAVVAQLPPTNANVLRMLLEVCHYAAHNATTTEMDALVGLGRAAALDHGKNAGQSACDRGAKLAHAGALRPRACARRPAPLPQALAQALAPCVAWLPPALKAPKGLTATGGEAGGEEGAAVAAAAAAASDKLVALEGDEAQAVVLVLENLISRFPQLFG
jgi:hypothetical protein